MMYSFSCVLWAIFCKHSKKYTLHALWFDCNFAPHNNQTE